MARYSASPEALQLIQDLNMIDHKTERKSFNKLQPGFYNMEPTTKPQADGEEEIVAN
jgi:hypothetical protein